MRTGRTPLIATLLVCGVALCILAFQVLREDSGAAPVPVNGGTAPTDHAPAPAPAGARIVRGVLRESTTEEGLPGFRVLLRAGEQLVAEDLTREDGSFELAYAARLPDKLELRPREGYVLEREELPLTDLDSDLRLEARRLAPLGVRGRLVDEVTREPVPHFELRVARSGRAPETLRTDAQGHFAGTTPLPDAPARVQLVDLQGLARDRRRSLLELVPTAAEAHPEVPVQVGPTFRFDLELPAPAEEFELLRAPRWPVAESELRELRAPDGWELAPVRAGRLPWARYGHPGPSPREGTDDELARWSLALRSKDGLWHGTAEVPATPGVLASPVELTLARTAHLRGEVRDARGRALGGATVSLGGGDGASRTLVTRGDGTFEALWVQPDTYAVRVRLDGYKPHAEELALPPGASTEHLVALERVGRRGRIAGRLRSRSGENRQPLSLRLVDLAAPERLLSARVEWQQETDGSWVGDFAFEQLDGGEYEIQFVSSPYHHRWSPDVARIRPPAEDVEFVLEDGAPLHRLGFRWESAAEEPRAFLLSHPREPGAPLWVSHGAVRPEQAAATVAADREFEWVLVADGYRAVSGTRADFAPAETDDLDEVCEVGLEPGWGACVVAYRPGRVPIEGARVLLDDVEVGRTNAQGFLHLARPSAPESLLVEHEGLERVAGNVGPEGDYRLQGGLLWVEMAPR